MAEPQELRLPNSTEDFILPSGDALCLEGYSEDSTVCIMMILLMFFTKNQ